MNVKKFVLDQLDVPSMWTVMFPGWKPDVNVSCAFAEAKHEKGRDATPSMSLSADGRVYCHTCAYKASSPIGFLEDLEEISFERSCRAVYNRYVAPLISEKKVRLWHEKLLNETLILVRLEERRFLTKDILKKFKIGFDGGRLTIPIRNEAGWVVNIRRYDILGKFDVGTKMISFKKGYGSARMWPLSSFKEHEVVLCEGELDTLVLLQAGYNAVTVSGGVNTWKTEWTKLFTGKTVWIIPDMDKIGVKGARAKFKQISKYAKQVTLLKLPVSGKKGDKDVTDWVLKKGDISKLRELDILEESEVAEEGALIPTEDLENPFEDSPTAVEIKNIERGEYALKKLQEWGVFYKNQFSEYFYAEQAGKTYRTDLREEGFIAKIVSISPLINQASSSGRFVLQHVANASRRLATHATSAVYSVADAKAIWIYAKEDTLLKIDITGKQSLLRNGTNEDSLLLECPPNNKPFTPVPDAKINIAVDLFHTLIGENLPCNPWQRLFVESWLLMAIFFTDYTRVRPILRFSASTATGKSTSTKLLSYLTYGEEVLNQSNTSAANYVLSEKSPLLLLDNLETRNMTPELELFLLGAATGASRQKRKMDTDAGLIEHRLKAMVCANGIEPFKTRELNSRVVEIGLNIEAYGKKNFQEVALFKKLKEKRGYILTGLAKLMATSVIPRLARGELTRISNELGIHSKRRFNEALAIQSLIVDAIFPYISSNQVGSAKQVTQHWIKMLKIVGDKQELGTNAVLYYLEQLVLRQGQIPDLVTVIKFEKDTISFKARTSELLSDFRRVARAEGTRCEWETDQHLGSRLQDSMEILKKAGWTRTAKRSGGRLYYEYRKNKNTSGNKKRTRRKIRKLGTR